MKENYYITQTFYTKCDKMWKPGVHIFQEYLHFIYGSYKVKIPGVRLYQCLLKEIITYLLDRFSHCQPHLYVIAHGGAGLLAHGFSLRFPSFFFFPLNFEFTKLIVDLGCGNIEQTTGSLYFWAAHLAGPKWGPFASWCCAWLETIGIVSGMGAQVNLATSFQHISCCILNLLYKYNGLQKTINLQ